MRDTRPSLLFFLFVVIDTTPRVKTFSHGRVFGLLNNPFFFLTPRTLQFGSSKDENQFLTE